MQGANEKGMKIETDTTLKNKVLATPGLFSSVFKVKKQIAKDKKLFSTGIQRRFISLGNI